MLASIFELTLTHIRRYCRFDPTANHMHHCRMVKIAEELNAKQCFSAYVGMLVGVCNICRSDGSSHLN